MPCAIIAAAILNCTSAQALSPADAVRVLTSHTSPWMAPPPMPSPYEFAMRNAPTPAPNPYSPFLTPATPIAPLAPYWSVTTRYGRNRVETVFNDRPRPGGVTGRTGGTTRGRSGSNR
jgi:hypothetical protein